MTPSSSITVRVPLAIRSRGGRKLVVTPDGSPATLTTRTRADPAMVKALARAHRWKRLLEEGRYASLSEMAKAERIDRGYIGKMLRLTLLAPDIVEAILDGRHPAELASPRLIEQLPVEWSKQRQTLLNPGPVPCSLHVQPSLDR
jgi:hypothetical protein